MITRRQFVSSSLALGLGAATLDAASVRANQPSKRVKPLVLHQTDLFHPHNDPDDHFDLAVVYALAKQNAIDLKGIVLDYPPDWLGGSPDVAAIAQMSAITSVATKFAVGGQARLSKRGDACPDLPDRDTRAIRFIIDELRQAPSPVAILIAGSATDVAVAAAREPELFREKCAGVYLNAGSAFPNPDEPNKLEYNVELNKPAYAAMFELPCPLYWFPCWHNVEDWKSGENSAFYWLQHAEAFDGISDSLAGYFAYMFEKSQSVDWLGALSGANSESWKTILSGKRAMWCTASQLLLTGKSVDRSGAIVELTSEFERSSDALFRMENVDVVCDDEGRTSWRYSDLETGRKIIRVLDVEAYPQAMAKAIAELLRSL